MTSYIRLCLLAVALSCLSSPTQSAAADTSIDYEYEPISYSLTTPENRISRLQSAIRAGTKKLERTAAHGYLPALLKELDILPSSQVMPFAKASLQDDKISPSTPRALYFNEETYVGFVQNGVIEIAVFDPKLGMAFYTLSQKSDPPDFHQETNRCLTCHGSVRARNVPGLMVRSVHPNPDGQSVVAAGSFRTDHTSPLKQRWGGWYVTGTHGEQTHLGNFRLPDNKKPKSIDNSAGQNVTDLSKFFDVQPYLTPHSDLVALMVLEHQIDAQNFMTRAAFETRIALHKANLPESTTDISKLPPELAAKVNASVEALAKHLLFAGETKLTSPIRGTSSFATDFSGKTPSKTSVLRKFDLQTWLFKAPLSYMIDSPAFVSLPPLVKSRVRSRLQEVLVGRGRSEPFDHRSLTELNDAIKVLAIID